ncbi:MAG: SMP-30/gluconolactonase/LRE family protein, partial [Planctomycetaceae bacterium]|nr:SMP-30/gluconolactonase/LRE family protein [Planctomycetaceae bacterium]
MTIACVTQAADDGLPTVGSIERLHPNIDALIAPGVEIEVLATGFAWSEGPVWVSHSDGGLPSQSLLFSDIPNNRIHCWNQKTGLSVFLEPAGFTGPASYGREQGSNGLALDAAGRLLCCEHGDRRISVLEKNGGKRTRADAWDGKRFNSPNDLAVHTSGTIYFTDPPYG